MNNLDCVKGILARHREARQWTDDAVAADILTQLDIKSDAEAKKANPAVDPNLVTEDQVKAAEAVAKEADAKAQAARDALHAQGQATAESEAHAAGVQPPKADAAPYVPERGPIVVPAHTFPTEAVNTPTTPGEKVPPHPT